MIADGLRRLASALAAPHPSVIGDDDRLGARLFAILLLVQVVVLLVSLVVMDAVLSWAFDRRIWKDADTLIMLAACVVLMGAYGLIRLGHYRAGVVVYIVTAVAATVGAPFSGDPNAEIGTLAAAVIPVLLTSIAFDFRWVLGVLVATLGPALFLLFATESPTSRTTTGLALVFVVAVTGGLIITYRHHLNRLESLRRARIREGEETRRKSEQQYRQLFDAISDNIFIADGDGMILEANGAACRDLGYERTELIGAPIARLSDRPPGAVQQTQRRVSAHGRTVIETVHRRKDGSLMPVELLVTPMTFEGRAAFLGIARDLTERRRGEEERERMTNQLQQAAKMESVGVLAGGVAHDFNNLLTAILGNADLASQDVPPGSSVAGALDEIHKAAASATALTRQLLAFSRKQVIEPRVFDLNGLVDRLHTMLRRLIGEDIRLQVTLADAPASVNADPGLIEQVVLNLAVNARDAMPDGGVLSLDTAVLDAADNVDAGRVGLPAGPLVRLDVADTGTGMSDDVMAHIFDPFFTTKPKGRGTGLGLAMVYGVITQAGGSIDVQSTPGAGSRFRILLPAAEASGSELKSSPGALQTGGGRETVLFVEDDDGVRLLGQRILEGLGYRVLVAVDGAHALELGERHEGPIHLLMTDVVMPGINGRQLAERLLALRPEARVLYTSGYTDDEVIRRGVRSDDLAFIGKPYAPRALAAKIRDILDRP
jgi:two-component system, cell cycle sensor histidine kinase and response regulator CckA